jgi:hypothetical protein
VIEMEGISIRFADLKGGRRPPANILFHAITGHSSKHRAILE